MRRAFILTLLAAAGLLGSAGASGQATPAALDKDLYQDALQSISEGRRNDASLELRRLIDKEPQHAGAWLELALTQCALGHGDEAERMFAIIETRFNPPVAMLRLIAEAREAGCDHWVPQAALLLSAGRGIDQNVNQGASSASHLLDMPAGPREVMLSSEFLPQHDQYTLLSADYTRELTSNGSVGFVQLLGRRNDALHRYDSLTTYAGLDTPWRYGEWTLRGMASGGSVMLGGTVYQRQYRLQGRLGLPASLAHGIQLALLGAVVRNDFRTLQNFDSTTYELRGLLNHRGASMVTQASLGYLADHGAALRPGGDRRGWQGSLNVQRNLAARLRGELSYRVQTWRQAQAYSPGLIETVRYQATHALRGTLTYQINAGQAWQLEATGVHDNENISLFRYNNRQLQLRWLWQY